MSSPTGSGSMSPMTPLSPLRSPLSPSSIKFKHRVPTQMRRCVPLYIGFVCVLLLILNADLLPSLPQPTSVLRRQSSYYQKPLKGGSVRGGSAFPKKIWQTWKVDPLSFELRDAETARSWTTKNPGYRYEVLTDANDVTYVEAHFGPEGLNRPDIVDMYRSLNLTIVKADILRYLVMYAEGGVYADIDVEALRPVSRFVPERYTGAGARDIDMVIGVEIDQPQFKDHPILGKKSESFCQWTFMARPHLPVMLRLVEGIMSWLKAVARKQGVPLGDLVLDFDEVIAGTGPSAFTAAVLDEMNRHAPRGRKVTWETHFHDMDESKVVGRILVLDVEAFAAGQGHSDSGNHNARGALVKHHYHASNWPARHPRFNHPVYGEVERCNWDVECVRRWDEDVANFKALSQDEQEMRIREKQMQPQ